MIPVIPMPDYQHIQCATDAGVTHVTFPSGRFDGRAVRELFELSNQLPESRQKLLVDCTDVDMVPSGGMGMLITIRKRFLSSGGQLHVAVPEANVMRSFRIANMQRLLSLFESVEQARAGFKP
ncbi:MAG: STAS domain-containing protein [Planctomycetota bacterium]